MPPLSHHQHAFTFPDLRSGSPARRDTPTLAEVLRQRAVEHGSKTAFTFIQDDLGVLPISYAKLYQAASAVASQVSAHADRGARALLLLPPGPDYLIAFFGCLLASVVAVPCYPPLNRRSSARVEGIVRDCSASLALVARGHTEKLKSLVGGGPQWLEVGWSDAPDGAGIPPVVREPRHEELCFLQYTSGSTGAPKGVRVTHRNLMANLEQIRRAFQPSPDFVGVSWLPPYHDMGLIGGLLEPVYAGGHHVILSPASFLQQPLRWLRYISDYRAAYAGGPNFAFELCARRATEEHKAGLDLSSWQVAFCGAEPLRADTLDRFVEAFEPCGFRREALLPCYGLAEATLLVTAQRAHTGPVYRAQEDGRREVSSGEPGFGVQMAIVDPSTGTRVEPGAVGEIWVAGDNVADGYWGNEEATRQTFGATLAGGEPDAPQFLRTGDLGSMHDGQLFVAGRLKDVLILCGRNVYPQDVEQASFNSHAGLRKDGAAVFSVSGEASEEMVVVQELEPRCALDSTMIGSIAAAVFDETGVQPHAVVLVKAGGIPRTSSGKIRRSQCKADYESGCLPVLASRIAASQPAPGALLPSSSEPLTPPQEPSSPTLSRGTIEAWLKQRLGEHLGVDPGGIDADQPFAFHGVSSLLAVQMVASLGQWLGRPLSPTLLWDHPSPSQLASHLAGEADRAELPAAVGHDVQVPVGAAVEPIAVIGLACRFPGADDAHEFWDLLHGGRDAVGPVPAQRLEAGTFVAAPGSSPQTRIGGFLRQVDQFDAHFFSISAVEAERIDPQQRLVLEVAWEALEDAAIAPSSLAGSLTGVYVGISAHDYEQHQTAAPDATSNLYAATGSASSVAPNRLSYLLDLRGPSMAIDTACSSSLVSLHLACQGLRHGETDLALAGGVNLILSDKASVAFAAAGMLAPDGRCKTFDEAANGYVRGEGCGVVVLKRLRDAQRDGDRVRAVIQGSAVHQDGRSNGLVAPNGLAQAEVIRRALQHAGVSPAQIGYIEAHGTGTALGDPIEFNALKRVFQDSDAPPCAIGSVKSGIGHLEAAAGIAGVIKTILSLEHETIPPHLHFRRLNPNCSLQGRPFDVPTTARPWPAAGGRRFAGVSSFGFGGTIAHVVLADAPHSRRAAADVPLPYQVLPLSAKSAHALERMTERIVQALRKGGTSLADAAVTLQTGRDAFPHRRLLVGSDAAEALSRWAQRDPLHVIDRRSSTQPAPVAFMFPGQGAQYARMAWQLYRHLPVFRRHIDAGLQALEPALREELRLALFPNEGSGPAAGEHAPLDRTERAQPALFIVEHALAQLWIDCGIQPAAMIGHSLGEYVAACVAGVFTLEEGVALVAERARLMQAMPGGAMVGVALDEARASTYCSENIALAAVNAPERCVLAGNLAAMDELMARLAADGVSHQRLRTSHAFHSPAMVPVREAFRGRVRAVDLRAPRIPYISNVTGTWITPEQATDPAYWARQLCEPVRFSQGLSTLTGDAPCTLIEVGPGVVLGGLVRQHGLSPSVTALPTLGREATGSADVQTMLTSLGRLWLEGHTVQWRPLHKGGNARRAALPAYPFDRQRFWLDATRHSQPTPVPASSLMHTPTVAQAAGPARPGHSNHRDRVRKQLVAMVAELLRSEPERVDPEVHLIELGADSLLIVQAVRRIEQSFGVTLTIRQLFEELNTISRIADHLAEMVPESPFPQERMPAVEGDSAAAVRALHAVPVQSNLGADIDAVERVISQQLHVMQLQLAALRSPASASVAPQPSADPRTPAHAMPASPSAVSRESASSMSQERGAGKFVPYQPARSTVRLDPLRHLLPRQKEYLEGFIARYVERTRRSKELTQRHRRALSDNRASAGFRYSVKEMLYPLVCQRSRGARVWDVDGNEYIDLTMGFGVNLFGHRPEFVEHALRAQMEEGWQLGPQTHLAGEVAQLVGTLTGMERVTFCNSGTEAVTLALRLARLQTGRAKIAFFSGSFHGWGDDTIAINDGARGTVPMAPGVQPGAAANTLVLDYGSPQALETIRAHAHELAAVLVEPVQSRLPQFQPREFLHELRAVTAQHGIALIFDEIITGFRLHPGGAQAYYGIRADMATYGKVAGGGMPVGLVAGAARWLDGVDGGMWQYGDDSYPQATTTFFAGTFCKHPLTLAATRAVLQRLSDEGPALQQALEYRTAGLVQRLNELFGQAQLPVEAVHCGSLFRLHTQQNIDLLYYHAIARGLYIWEGRNMFLSTAHTDGDIDRVVEIFAASIRELQDGGIFPPPLSGLSGPSGEPRTVVQATTAQGSAVDGARARQATLPLTAAQRGIWVECQLDDEAALAYNAVFALRLRGPLRSDALHRAVAAVVARHESLRTVIDEDGQRQHVLSKVDVPLDQVDLSGSPNPVQAAQRWYLDNNRRRFDLSAGPLLRTDLLKLAAQEHLLVISLHHAISDGISQAQMLQEIALCYSAACDGVMPVLPTALRYADYVAGHERYTGSDRIAADEQYWLEQFRKPLPGPLALPAAKHAVVRLGSRAECMHLVIEGERYAKLQAAGSARGCTLFMTLLAAVGVLLHRLSGREDIVLGVPMAAGRDDEGDGALLGCTLNLVPIRCQPRATQAFSKYLSSIKQCLLEALRHADYPFASLVKAVRLEPDPVRRPLAPILFNLSRASDVPRFQGLTCQLDAVPVSFGPDELFIDALQLADRLDVKFQYKVDFFDRDGLQRMVEAFDALLDSIVEGMDEPLGRLALLRPREREQLLYELNDTTQPYALQCVHHMFEAQARRTPDAPAVVFEERCVSYRELNEQADRLARHLIAVGVGADSRVAIGMHRGIDLLVALLGTWKAGGAYVPLDPDYPAQRLARMLADSAPAVLLTQQALLPAMQAMLPARTAVLCVDVELPQLAQHPSADLPSRAGLQHLAYVIHTSGSTGAPKGVMVEHRALANFLRSMQQAPGMDEQAVLLAVTSLSFDIAALELYLPLLCGGTVVIASRHDAQDSERLGALIERHGVNVMQGTPATWRLLLDQDWSRFPPLKVLCGGEALQPALAQELIRRAASVWNLYGPTETTVWSAVQRLRSDDVVTIGRPIGNTRIHVLDANLQPVPIGVPGELHIGGIGLARGYLHQPRLTAERFVADPFRPSERLYKTGDLARYLPDGRIECLGRLDHQVKVRGYRIELGEIEQALLQLPSVREAVVVARDDAAGDRRLVAYLVPQAHGEAADALDAATLREQLSLALPAYMVPAAFVMQQALPLTPNGKIDRNALPEPEADALAQQTYTSPQTATERALVLMWSELLNLPAERIGRDDDFFALGGHSLQAMTLLARIRKSFEMQLPLRTLFEARTVRRLAEAVDASRVRDGAEPGRCLGIERIEEQADYEVSAAQRRLWLLQQLDPGSTAYHVPALLELPPGVDRSALQSALSQVLARHEALRTVIVAGEEGMPKQRVQPAWPVEVGERCIDDEASLKSHHERFISEPFDLSHGPLFRAEVLHTWDGRQLLAWCMHEIIADGSSAVILEREVQALLKGGEAAAALKALPIQHKDFAAWQNRLLREEDGSRQYWHEQFGAGLARLELPYDQPPSALSNAAAQYPVAITGATHQALLNLCRRLQVTLAMLLQAAVAAWLSRLTGSRDIVLAVPVSGRDVSEVEPLIGFFLNTVLLRMQVEPEASFEHVLGESRQVAVNALQHQHYPFEQLIEELDLPRPPNQFPVTPVLFNVLNFRERNALGEVPVEHQLKTLGAKAELEFTVLDHADGLLILCDYRTALFKPSTIEYLMQQLQSLLDQVGQAPERRIAALDVFADARVGQLRSPYLQFANELPSAQALPGVLERFAQQVQAGPDATAIEWQDRQCTYVQLQAHSDRIARQLRALGCRTGDIVALLLPDPIQHIAAVLGAMKAGAVFMTLEASDPAARLQSLVARVSPHWWIAEHASAEVLAQLGTSGAMSGLWLGEVVVPGLGPLTVDPVPVEPPAEADACYLFFTSGSTGQPKPILGRAASLAQFIDWEIEAFGLQRGCRVSQLTSPTFDAWLRDVFVPLCAGGTVCVPPQRKTEPDRLLAWLDQSRVELVHCVPSVLRTLLAYAKQADEALPDLAALRRVCLSGEPVLPALVQAWHGAFGDRIELVNFYGASETTMIRCWHRITPQDLDRGFIPIGRPIAHTQAIVLDGQGQVCAPGTPGEIWLRSRFFTLGYHGDEARTAEVFVSNPLRPQDEVPVYRSGDLAVVLDDGSLRCLGRRDGQVKVNGVRIELGEIESALMSHPHIREAAVTAHTGDDGSTRLIAHVVCGDQTVEDLHRHLAQRLPASLLPQGISLHEALPLTSSGKIDRKALVARNESAAPVQATYLAPVTDTERMLAQLYGQVLERERIGRDDDFFALGGHSLQALMLLARIRKSFGVQLALRTLFEARTVRYLAEAMDRQQLEAEGQGVTEQEDKGDRLPLSIPRSPADLAPALSLQQRRLWFLDQFEPAGTAYNIAAAVQVNGKLDVDALQYTLNELVRRHEVLRTTFASMDGVPVQVIAPSLELQLPITDLSGLVSEAREARARALIDQEVAVPFNLAAGPLVRARLLRLGEAEHILLFTLHHVVSDGWSMGVLVREVGVLYAAFVEGRPSPLQDLAIQYADYAQRQWLAGDVLQAQLDYWKQQLAGAPALLALPTDRPRPAVETHHGAVLRFAVPEETTAGLRMVAQQAQSTLFMVLAAAFNVLLWRYSAQDDIVIGTPVANRPRQELEPLIGCFVNTLVLRTRLHGRLPFVDLLQRVKATTLDAYTHQEVPFEQLVEVLNPVRDTGHAPLFQVMLTLQNAPMSRLELGGLQLGLLDIDSTQAKFDLSLDFTEEGGQLRAELEYNTDLFERGTMERLAGHWLELCAGIVADPGTRISQLPLLDAAQRQKLLVDWNDSARSFPLEQTYAQLFARQVQADPERVAAVCGDESWSYGELDRRSQYIAHALHAAGAGPETLVVLVGRRDLTLMSLMIGVLKAGAAFLPLDVNHPVERLREIVQVSAAQLLVATPSARELIGPLTAGMEVAPTCLESEALRGAGVPAELAPQGGPGSLAYVVYTSGSTGQPKGVAIEQRGMLNNMLGKVPTVGLCGADRVAQTASVAFDIAIWQFLAGPLVGACTCILDDETVRDPRRLTEAIEARQLSLLEIVPSALRAMLDLCGPQVQLPTLRWVLPTGEALPASLAQQWRERFPRIGLMNLYGPAECSDDVAAHAVDGATAHGAVSIGRPTANNLMFILDQALQPVPVGVTGELCIAGTGVARGYLGRPELTAEGFVPNPFGPPGSRMYRSGDLGRWLPDGTIEHVGRNDHQVKLRGFRIELCEIEACLLRQPGVHEAAALVRDDMAGNPRLVAYVVAQPGQRVESQALREALQQRLPQYMVPTHFMLLDALPLTPNGKLDRSALPAPDALVGRAEYMAPRTPTEERLSRIWAEVLGVESVGVHDDFFELGGHSLSGLMLLARIRTAFGVELAVRAVFESTTLEELAGHIDERLRAKPSRSVETEAALSEALEELNALISTGEGP